MSQENSYDCGLFALSEMLLHLKEETRRFSQEDMENVRSHMAYQLISGSIGLDIYKSPDPRRVVISDAAPDIKTISPRKASDGVDRNATPLTESSQQAPIKSKTTASQAAKPKLKKRKRS
jgi:hypothetical protein